MSRSVQKAPHPSGIAKRGGIVLALIAVTAAVFFEVHGFDFIDLDDPLYVTKNIHLRAGLSFEGIRWAFTTIHAEFWHPLTWLSLLLDYQLYGLNPGGYHLTNIFLHIASTVFLFLVLNRMTGALWRSAFVSALFALHPLHVESVVWIAERKDVLSTFFWVLTLGAYALYVEKRVIGRYGLALFFFVLGLMSKPMLVTLPFVLLLLDFWPLGRMRLLAAAGGSASARVPGRETPSKRQTSEKRGPGRVEEPLPNRSVPWIRLVAEKVPFLALGLIFSAVAYYAQLKGGTLGSQLALPLAARVANAIVSYVRYLGETFWPVGLGVYYPHPGVLPPGPVLICLLFLIAATAGVCLFARRFPYLPIGWFWYIGTLVPVIQIIQVGSHGMADRYTYIPLIGIFMLFTWGVTDLFRRVPNPEKPLAALGAFTLAGLSVITWIQISHWRDSSTLFRHTLSVTDRNSTIHTNLGAILSRQGKAAEAAFHFGEAIRIDPTDLNARFNLGNHFWKEKDYAKALDLYQQVLRMAPHDGEANFMAGRVLAATGKDEQAIEYFRLAIANLPGLVPAYVALGDSLVMTGRVGEAVSTYDQALALRPDLAELQKHVGTLLLARKKGAAAIPYFEKAVRVNPDDPEAYQKLAEALALSGRKTEAQAALQRAVRLPAGHKRP